MWQGSGVFNCPNNNNEIILCHLIFHSSVIGVCNDGAIVGENLRVDGSSYTSQLNIIYEEQFACENVTCSHDNGLDITSTFSSMIVHDMTSKIHTRVYFS